MLSSGIYFDDSNSKADLLEILAAFNIEKGYVSSILIRTLRLAVVVVPDDALRTLRSAVVECSDDALSGWVEISSGNISRVKIAKGTYCLFFR